MRKHRAAAARAGGATVTDRGALPVTAGRRPVKLAAFGLLGSVHWQPTVTGPTTQAPARAVWQALLLPSWLAL